MGVRSWIWLWYTKIMEDCIAWIHGWIRWTYIELTCMYYIYDVTVLGSTSVAESPSTGVRSHQSSNLLNAVANCSSEKVTPTG
jgi:hypothetical protein